VVNEHNELRRVRFYGVHDLAAGFHAPRAVEIATNFDRENVPNNVVDVLELHNVQRYLENGLIPSSCPNDDRARLMALVPQIGSVVARFFSGVDSSNFAAIVTEVQNEYFSDLIYLLGRAKVFDRCDSKIALPALRSAGVHLGEIIASRSLVRAYDTAIRDELLASTASAELIVRQYLEKDARREVYLPPSFTSQDARKLFERYIDSEKANLNYVRLIANANDHARVGIDARLRLQAKRRSDVLNAEIFDGNVGFKAGWEVSISDSQNAPVSLEVDKSDGSTWRFTYSSRWLKETLDNPSILNNFQHLFEFADSQVLLTLPSYPAALGVMERVMGLTGIAEYKIGSAFRAADSISMIQTLMYRQFLAHHEIDLEQVMSWFCGTYLDEEFGAQNFSFNPSTGGNYLEKVRHLFAEMESVANQFDLYVQDGELDRDLLSLRSDQTRFKDIPSLLVGKYVYASHSPEIASILHLLFSDQSPLLYIDETLQADSAAKLLVGRQVAYKDFHDYQKTQVDMLVDLGVLEDTGARVQFASREQFFILAALFKTQAASYYHLSVAGRAHVDAMVARGWVMRRSSLLTEAEGDYFNYFLNRVGFSNGPNLRNKYQHGSQPGLGNAREHSDVYVIGLRLCIALLIKINDDLCLSTVGVGDPQG
jgi:hypothetical protein